MLSETQLLFAWGRNYPKSTEIATPKAAGALRLTSGDLLELGVIDHVLPEPLGGAHRAPREMANTLKTYLTRQIRDLIQQRPEELLVHRYSKFRGMGAYA